MTEAAVKPAGAGSVVSLTSSPPAGDVAARRLVSVSAADMLDSKIAQSRSLARVVARHPDMPADLVAATDLIVDLLDHIADLSAEAFARRQ